MQVYLINLGRHPERLRWMAVELGPVAHTRIEAIDGRDLEGADKRPMYRKPGHDGLTRFERAVIASHGLAWQRLRDAGEDCCCVLEDDIHVSRDFAAFAAAAHWIPQDAHLVKLETMLAPIYAEPACGEYLGRAIRRLRSVHLGAAGYIITRRGVDALAPLFVRSDHPLDDLMFSDWLTNELRIYQLTPALCIQAWVRQRQIPDALTTSIQGSYQTKKPPMDRLRAELTRPFRRLGMVARRTLNGTYLASERMVVPFR
jgi:glycosyl transferase family 25